MEKFNFYKAYWDGLDTLNPFQLKKVLKALSKYADTGELPKKLSLKGMAVFNQIQRVILEEKLIEEKKNQAIEAGKKGAKARWNRVL